MKAHRWRSMLLGLVAVAWAVGAFGMTQAASASQIYPGPGRPIVTVINLERAYQARLGHSKSGKIGGIIYSRGRQPKASTTANACAEPDCPLVYNGGPVQHSPQVYLLLWGPNWSSDPGQQASAAYLRNFYSGLGVQPQDTWSDVTMQYGDGSGTPAFSGSVYMGAWQDTSSPPTGVGQSGLAAEADALASYLGISDLADAQIIVATQSGTCPAGFYAPNCAGGSGYYCAWHAASNEPFTNLPYLLDAGAGCGQDFVNPNGTYDGFSIVGGHEYAETITDPSPGSGWWDPSDSGGGEIGDKCAWVSPSGDVSLSSGSFAMQSLWSNSANGCVMAGTPAQDTVTVTSPGNQTTDVGSQVSLQVQGSSSGGHPLTWSATGLPAGLQIGSTTGTITGAPTTAGTYNVTVQASDTTSATGSASFTWTVNPAGDTVTVTSPGNQTTYVGGKLKLQVQGSSSGGHPLTWTATGLPAGLQIGSTTGTITGAPTTAGTYNVTVQATDTTSATGSASFTWTVNPDVGSAIKGYRSKCLDDYGSWITSGNKVVTYTCTGAGAELWSLSSGELVVFGQCLTDPKDGGAYTKLVIAACTGSTSQLWTHAANGEYVLQLNGLCLTEPSTKNGTQVQIRACHAYANQKWSGT